MSSKLTPLRRPYHSVPYGEFLELQNSLASICMVDYVDIGRYVS